MSERISQTETCRCGAMFSSGDSFDFVVERHLKEWRYRHALACDKMKVFVDKERERDNILTKAWLAGITPVNAGHLKDEEEA